MEVGARSTVPLARRAAPPALTAALRLRAATFADSAAPPSTPHVARAPSLFRARSLPAAHLPAFCAARGGGDMAYDIWRAGRFRGRRTFS